jgi:hypothetical protein
LWEKIFFLPRLGYSNAYPHKFERQTGLIMSGLYIQHVQKNDKACRVDKMLESAIRLPDDRLIKFAHANFSCAIIHHNNHSSCGVNSKQCNYTLALQGCCWLHDNDSILASPDDTLAFLLNSGFSGIGSLKGSYVFAFYDHLKDELIIENDLFGVYPLYYIIDAGGNIYISSEIKALAPFSSRKVCLQAVAEILKYGYIATDLTLVEDIRRLMPNTRLVASNGKLRIVGLAFPEFTRSIRADENVVSELNGSFLRNIRRYKENTDTLSISLSGGLDSRIAAFAARRDGYELKSFSSGETGSLECRIAKQVASRLSSNHSCYEYDGSNFADWIDNAIWITEGRCHPGHMHFLEASISGHCRPEIQLHGLIGDAVIGGDFETREVLDGFSAIKSHCLRSMQSFIYWPSGYLDSLACNTLHQELLNTDERIADFIFNRIGFSGGYSDYLWFRYHFRVFGFTIPCLTSQILPWTDPAFPYIDNNFFNISGSIRREDLLDRMTQIRWACKYYPGIAELPRVKDGVLIKFGESDENDYDKKIKRLNARNLFKYYLCRLSNGAINLRATESYPYYDRWYRKWPEIRKYFSRILISDECLDRGLWNRELVKNLQNDLKKGKKVWNALSSLLLIEIFLRQFLTENHSFDSSIIRTAPRDQK